MVGRLCPVRSAFMGQQRFLAKRIEADKLAQRGVEKSQAVGQGQAAESAW